MASRRPGAPAESIGLLVGAEADSARYHSPRATSQEEMHRHLPRLSTGSPGDESDIANVSGEGLPRATDDTEPSPGFLGRVDSYARLMHAHTKSQLDSPSMGTIPTYARTMHAHTLNQLNGQRRTSKSGAISPQPATRHAILPVKICNEMTKMRLDAVPQPPSNTPDQAARKVEPVLLGIDFGKLRRRSLTTPYAARDFAAVEARDFALAAVE